MSARKLSAIDDALCASDQFLGLLRSFVFALPAIAVFAPFLPGIGLSWFRLATLVLALFALTYPAVRGPTRVNGSVLTLAVVWVGVGSALTVVALDRGAAVRTMTAVVTGLILTLASLRIMNREPKFLRWITHGWIATFAATTPIAIWEITSGDHLPGYFLDAESQLSSRLPAVTFYNPNAYAIFLLAVHGVILWRQSRSSRNISRSALLLASVLCGLLILATGSRLCLAGFGLQLLVFFFLDRIGMWRVACASALVALAIWLAWPSMTSSLYEYVPADVRTTSINGLVPQIDQADSSLGRRIELYKSAAWLTWASGGMGVGPGNFGVAIVEYDPPFRIGETRSPHSFIAELAAEFGILILFAFFSFFVSILRRVWHDKSGERSVILATGLGFVPGSLANSGYLSSSTMWTFFATILCWVFVVERGKVVS